MTKPTPLLSVAGPNDLDHVLPLVQGFRDSLGAADPPDDALRVSLAQGLADPSLEFALAALDGVPVGYTQTLFRFSVWAGGTTAFLDDLFVSETARRQKLGRTLLDHALDRARAHGAKSLSLTTNEKNVPAQTLYKSAGLVEASEPRWGDGRDVAWIIQLDHTKRA